ncbi:MAG: hypothetical protein ACREPE_15135, partial [Lysobacter sp.]
MLAITAGLAGLAMPAYSQQTPTTPAPATASAQEEEPTTLATMMVTAQKREEAMQDVPISVTALP